MKGYRYKGKNQAGLEVQGATFAESRALAKMKLYKAGLVSFHLQKQKVIAWPRAIHFSHICNFSHKLATLLNANIPLTQALEILIKNEYLPKMQLLLLKIKQDIENGLSFYQALAKHPKHFNSLYCHLVYVGEQSATLSLILNEIAIYQEKIMRSKNQIKNALFYPAIVLTLAGFMTIGMLFFIVPSFESLFKNLNAELPWITQCLIQTPHFMQAYALKIFLIITLFLFSIFQLKKHSFLRWELWFSVWIIKLPFFGNLFINNALGRFLKTLSMTFKAGLSLSSALEITAGKSDNVLFQQAILNIKKDVSQGLALHEAMRRIPYFAEFILQMIAIGEESGTLDNMLYKCADFYEKEVDNLIKTLGHFIEPVIMSFLGLLIGGLVLALYLPIFKLGSVL